jgi:predicted AAA+ superfamily ATPase
MGTDLIKVITGIRRCGKSVMLELLREELISQGVDPGSIISLNFEDMSNTPLCNAKALHDYITGKMSGMNGKPRLFFDEIQEVAEWERCVNSLRTAHHGDIYITGSNAKLLSGELATYLAGRYVEIPVSPFSFAEFAGLYKTVVPEAAVPDAFTQYLSLGGMPFLHNLQFREEPCRQYLRDIYTSVVLKDIVKRHNIREVDLLERIIVYVMANAGQPFSATSISKYLKSENRMVSPETILNYLGACENAFLLYRSRMQDLRGKKILTINEKFYVADHGIREAVCGKTGDINIVLENIVYMELCRRGYKVTTGRVQDREIDFVCEKNGEKEYIQTAYLLASPETAEREFAPLRAVRDNYPKYVLTLDEFDFSRGGIRHRNIRDFLLEGI